MFRRSKDATGSKRYSVVTYLKSFVNVCKHLQITTKGIYIQCTTRKNDYNLKREIRFFLEVI